jgi:hypothetical protein
MIKDAIRMIAAAFVAFLLCLLALAMGWAEKFHNLIW